MKKKQAEFKKLFRTKDDKKIEEAVTLLSDSIEKSLRPSLPADSKRRQSVDSLRNHFVCHLCVYLGLHDALMAQEL
ncbi:hypothetical protein AGMMS50268_01710 [Spirochaetia bacterium]|nr:hypothetical protein AGMMS50268_01710 [Spirochaetia bacterium]